MPETLSIPFRRSNNQEAGRGRDPALVRWLLILVCVSFLAVFLLLPLLAVFATALSKGIASYFQALTDPEAFSAIRLTLITAATAVPLNLIFGLAAAWTIARFDFFGKRLLITLIDVPFSISPVISGMVFVLLFGAQGLFGKWLMAHDIRIVFALPGLILATTFVTFPYVARELIPTMQAVGSEEEEAALALGAGGWRTFLRITLPNIKWSLLYGVILCNARAMGEFGAVSVVSGHIRGLTNTMPLYIEILYNDYQLPAAFAVASLLTFLALLTLIAKSIVEWKSEQELTGIQRIPHEHRDSQRLEELRPL
jgi:sulfate/thiosulfate transport system permease protein